MGREGQGGGEDVGEHMRIVKNSKLISILPFKNRRKELANISTPTNRKKVFGGKETGRREPLSKSQSGGTYELHVVWWG